MLERGEGEKREIDSSARLLAIPSSMLGFEETSILKNPKVISPRKIRYLKTVLPDEASVAGGQVCHTTFANRSHPSISQASFDLAQAAKANTAPP